jgi:cellulose synthase/poly-beta-1,6-N-acetylglucosamine synthase-like glycosyltransferase
MRLCWLFCLTPAVFYYLVADVYYCILRNSH